MAGGGNRMWEVYIVNYVPFLEKAKETRRKKKKVTVGKAISKFLF